MKEAQIFKGAYPVCEYRKALNVYTAKNTISKLADKCMKRPIHRHLTGYLSNTSQFISKAFPKYNPTHLSSSLL